MDDKEYLTPDPGLGTSHSTLKEGHVPHLISETDWDAIENEARAYSIADRLVEMVPDTLDKIAAFVDSHTKKKEE